jgi:hypothetical protein
MNNLLFRRKFITRDTVGSSKWSRDVRHNDYIHYNTYILKYEIIYFMEGYDEL